jgi:hypothetical protein
MSTVEEIESAIQKLPPPQLTQLSQWFEDYLEQTWDARMEADARAGKLSRFKEEAARAREAGELLDCP